LMTILIAGCAPKETKPGKMDLPSIPPLEENATGAPASSIPNAAAETTQQPAEEAASEIEVDYTEYQQKPTVSPLVPTSYRQDIPKLTIDCYGEPCLDYLGAYTMAARYFDKGIDFISVVGYGNIGGNAKMWSNQDLDNNMGETSMIRATQKYGFSYELGIGLKGTASQSNYALKFEDTATKVSYFNNKDDALAKMKAQVSSRHPVIVYLDVSLLQQEFADHSTFWNGFPGESKGHFMIVTGYDDNFVYLNDPNDAKGTNLPAPKDKFLLAWEATKFLEKDRLGPFWMFALNRSDNRKVEAETIIEQNNADNAKAPDELKKFATQGMKSDDTCDALTELAKTRGLYSDFLERYDRGMSSTMYQESESFLRYACEEGIRTSVETASTKEQNAQKAI
ncbi:MAG: C39 family peptidase, partial [Nanoarchaeota archaeon]|nr:C39 family peptidase [Nanoarchaeota archaeon]